MKRYYVYSLVDPVTKLPFYIGKGSTTRALKHLKETKQNTENYKKWCYIEGIRNKGFEPELVILYSNLTEDESYEKEKSLILSYGRKDIDQEGILTNICEDNRPPNNTGRKHTEEVRSKMSQAQRKWWSENKRNPRSEESKRKTSEKVAGSNNPMFGKSAYDKMVDKYGKEEADFKWKERARKASESLKGKPRPESVRLQISKTQKGVTNVGTKCVVNVLTGKVKKVHVSVLDDFLSQNLDWKIGVKI